MAETLSARSGSAPSASARSVARIPPTGGDAADGSDCAREPIHRLGSIQPHGALLVLDQDAGVVRFASATLGRVLGVEAQAAIGRLADSLLSGWLSQALAALPADAERPCLLEPPPGSSPERPGHAPEAAEVLAHRGDDGLVVEFVQPIATAHRADPGAILRRLVAELAAGDANPFRDAHALAQAAQQLTGFERCMVYRFRPDWSGEVVAEVRAPHLMPFLGLRFPADDIPAQARALYVRNKVRVTVDASEAQAPLLPASQPPGHVPPNLGMAVLRSVSPTHLQYLLNMGVRSSLVASILVDDLLWGMLACHHDQPALPAAPVREGLERLADAFAPAVRRQRARAHAAATQQVAAAEARLALIAARPLRLLPQLVAGPDNLMRLCDADGIAWCDDRHAVAIGAAPSPDWLRAMLPRLMARDAGGTLLIEMTSLQAIAGADGAAAGDTGQAAGMLAAPLPGGGLLALFREEFVHEVAWGGDPGKPAVTGPGGALGPRTSFALWRESVRGSCRPWRDGDRGIVLGAARMLAEATAAEPQLGAIAWDDFVRLGARGGPGTLRLADLLPHTEAVAVTLGSGMDAPTLFVSDPMQQLLGAAPPGRSKRPWREVAAALGIAHAFAPDGQVQARTIEAWSPERGPTGLVVSRAPLLQLHAAHSDGTTTQQTLSMIRIADQTRVSRAINARDAAEARSERVLRTQEAMLRNLTHELRSPVHAIMGLGELVAEAEADALADIRVYGGELVAAARHLLSLIDAMLDLARIESGELVAASQALDLPEVVREAAAIARPLCAAKSIRFTATLPDRPVPMRGDARLLRQAILNLLGNAARFTPSRGRVGCTLEATNDTASITVSDTGPGIPVELQQKVFEPFFQAEDAARHHGGLGLGLFFTRTFVGLHGGRVSLASPPGEGATFRIDLPLPPAAP